MFKNRKYLCKIYKKLIKNSLITKMLIIFLNKYYDVLLQKYYYYGNRYFNEY